MYKFTFICFKMGTKGKDISDLVFLKVLSDHRFFTELGTSY